MKPSEMRKLSATELREKCEAALVEYKKVKLALKTGEITPENVNKARNLKAEIARMKTVLKELSLITNQ